MNYIIKCFLFFAVLLSTSLSYGKFKYMSKLGLNRCTACHVSPTGGAIRNAQGKAFGQHGYKMAINKRFSSEALSADVRMIYYSPENDDQNRGGLGLMTGSLGLNVPLYESESGVETRLVYSHNLGGFGGSSPQDAYVRWRFEDDSETSFRPQYLLVGRFHLPFGILTDEHRTYVRAQNNSSWNDYDMGFMLSANPFLGLHYDVGLVNGEKTSGTGFRTDGAAAWGSFANVRYTPSYLPLILGASFSRHAAPQVIGSVSDDPESIAVYASLNLQRWVSFLPLVVTHEYQQSKNWNKDSLFAGARYINPSNGYAASVVNSTSVGQLLRFDLDLSDRLSLIYKYESLLLNKNFSGDTYVRNGFGIQYILGPNMILNARYEKASGGSGVDSKSSSALQDTTWLLLQVSI